jgi:hypothetical protein
VALEELLQRMLAKAPERRFPDASSLLAALAPLQAHLRQESSPPLPTRTPPLRFTGSEQYLVSVLLAAPRSTSKHASAHLPPDSGTSLRDTLRNLLAPHGAQVELLTDGSLAVTLMATHGSTTDPATLAARCALLIQERWPEAAVVLTTGRGTLDPYQPVGEAMDRAGQLLRQLESLTPDASAQVMLDEVTAGLLGSGFQLSRLQPELFLLLGEKLGADASRPLLGKPTPCVGREQELAWLELTFTTCAQEPVAQAVLVKAPAGMGKSRLRHEFLRRLEHRGHPVRVLVGRGDPMMSGSDDGLLGQALRQLWALSSTESLEVLRARLAQHVGARLPAAQAQEVAAFLGELCGIPFPDEHNPRLRVAREDPQQMSKMVGRALVAFLRAECAHQPVLVILEDLHWGDALSVRLMDEALRELADQPLMVLALARPEVMEVFPGLWASRLQEVPLRGLNRKASARLVREVLGPQVPDALIDQLVEQAAGNALFLEELIRGAAEGRREATLQTVLAMLQARLGRLEAQARQVLLAASLFSRSFWSDGVLAVLGEELSGPELERCLEQLVAWEWVEPQVPSRFPAHAEYRFRHALVQDAAYGLVPESYKPTGHRLAGLWLEQAGENNPQVLAEHARLGQQPERAIHFLTRAAEQHFQRHDLPGALRCVESALALGAQGGERVRLRALQVTVSFWMGDLKTLFERGPEVLAELRPGSRPWYWLWTGLYLGHSYGGSKGQAAALGQQLLRTQPEPEAREMCLEALCAHGGLAVSDIAREESSACLEFLLGLGAGTSGAPVDLASLGSIQGMFSYVFEARPWQSCLWLGQGQQGFFEVGLERHAVGMRALWAHSLGAVGERARAEAELRENLDRARQLRVHFATLHSQLYLALFLAHGGEPACQEEALALANDTGTQMLDVYTGLAHLVRARVAAARGALTEAEAWARKAYALLTHVRLWQFSVQVLLSQVLLAQGRAAEAREVAALGVRWMEETDCEGHRAVALYLALAEACLAEGDTPAGEAALRRASQCLRKRAEDVPEGEARERFLQQVPENARVLALTRERWGEPPGG